MFWLIFIGIFSFLTFYLMYEHLSTKRKQRMLKDVPGPKSYPIVGSALAFGRNSVELMGNLNRLATDEGPIVKMWMGPTLWILLSDAKDIEAVLNNTVHLEKPQVYDFLYKWLGTGLVSAPATKWRVHRKILTPAFHFKILETYVDIFNTNVRIMVDLLRKKLEEPKLDIAHFIDKCTLDIICETAMATNIDAQLNEESEFTKALKVVSNAILVRSFKPWLFPEFTFNLSPLGREFNKSLEYINNFVDNVITEKKKTASATNNIDSTLTDEQSEENFYGTKKRYVFLDLLLKYSEDPAIHLSDKDLRDEVNTFMFAGHDTTASTIGFVVYCLAAHPEVQVKVVEELTAMFGDSDRDPTYQDLMGLKYMEQVIKETLRLYPAVPFIGRKLYEDLTLPSGVTMPSGASLSLFLYKMQRDPRVFPNPECFNPDNFLPENTANRYAFAYTPFSAGPRNCIGQKFAMLEMKSTLSRLFRSFQVTTVSPAPVLASELILRSATGINVKLQPRL